VPSLLLQKFPARTFTVETALEFAPVQAGEQAGLLVVGRAHATLCLRQTNEGTALVFQVANEDQWSVPFPSLHVQLRVTVQDGGACVFAYEEGNGWKTVPIAFTAEKAEWIGARIGIYSLAPTSAEAGHCDFDYFRFSAPV
jgi:beta-xylosidase